MVFSCKDCGNRFPGCHGSCETYKAERAEYKMEIAEAIVKELDEDQSKKKELIVIRRDLAVRLKEILGQENWEKYKTLFPFVREYWEW